MAPTVGHFVKNYLPLTQTFVYRYLTSHSTYVPFVCGIRSENTDRFPFEPRYVFMDKSRFDPRFWVYGALAKFDLFGLENTHYRNVIDRTDPDVLHAHFGPRGVELEKYRRDNRPLVTSFYGYDASQLVEGDDSMRAKYQKLFAKGDLFLVEGPAMRQKLLALDCPEEKIALQRIAIDTDRIEPCYPDLSDGLQVLMVGRFVEKKGMPDGIRAFASALGDVEGAELRIVGGESGEYTEADLREIAAAEGVSDQVVFAGFLPYEEYLGAVHECDVLLAPSKRAESGDSEGGAPTVLLEAQASGKPVVATTHADIPYVVEDGIAGRLVTPGDVESLADALCWCRDHPEHLTRMGRAGRENMKAHHNVTELARQLETRYDRLL
ncbi:hypothetical protein BV210_11690 [Halorientalis sp. IM1011]|uniref:glycosyltransferase n=1 Tax=Halorientalis sp. IM1011 TaxID=1932360 RepID=UPI00097CC544|nr:glycosyltransferase [Halorientalis sp. IM1011]AQL43313.1 hypothetical protein BV210_11690 [Halorientalis sp. IM1011]